MEISSRPEFCLRVRRDVQTANSDWSHLHRINVLTRGIRWQWIEELWQFESAKSDEDRKKIIEEEYGMTILKGHKFPHTRTLQCCVVTEDKVDKMVVGNILKLYIRKYIGGGNLVEYS